MGLARVERPHGGEGRSVVSDVGEELNKQLAEAIEGVFQRVEGGIVTKWLLIAETVGPDGERRLWANMSDDLKPWELIGMLRFIEQTEGAAWKRDDEDDEN